MPALGAEPARRRVRPYLFQNLEKVTRSQLDLTRRLEWLLPDGLLSGELGDQVKAALRRVFDEDVLLWLDYVHTVAPSTLPRIVREPTFLASIAPSPHRARGAVEVELAFAHSIIDLLLGAGGEAAIVRPLTEIEEGVLSYVLLETFKALSPQVSETGRERIRLEQPFRTLDEALALFEQESSVAVIELKVLIGAAAGYIRLLLPASTIAAAVPLEDGPERRARRLARLQRNLPRLASVRAWLRAEIGHVDLTGADLLALRPGDVMLVDELTARVDKGEPGPVRLRVGLGRAGRIEGTLEVSGGGYTARIDKIVPGPEPLSEAPDDEAAARLADAGEEPRSPPAAEFEEEPSGRYDPDMHTSPGARSPWDDDEKTSVTTKPEDNHAIAAELLNDVPLHVVVELARVPVSADEVLGLHAGQIIELGKAPGEPVELSVNGKVVARGELVEIEGQLGVRIASLSE
jgi:type III secretion system YscQ/HrcQ family protein